jgi:hypothetical protein
MGNYTSNYSLRCTDAMHKALNAEAKKCYMSVSKLTQKVVIEYLAGQGYDVEKMR